MDLYPEKERKGFEVGGLILKSAQFKKDKSRDENINSGHSLIRIPAYQIQGKESDVKKANKIIEKYIDEISKKKPQSFGASYIYDALKSMSEIKESGKI